MGDTRTLCRNYCEGIIFVGVGFATVVTTSVFGYLKCRINHFWVHLMVRLKFNGYMKSLRFIHIILSWLLLRREI